jgi:hypothetical protein
MSYTIRTIRERAMGKMKRSSKYMASRRRERLKSSKSYGYHQVNWGAIREHFDFGRRIDEPIQSPNRPQMISLERKTALDQIQMLQQTDFRQFVVVFNKVLISSGRFVVYRHFSGQQEFFTRTDKITKITERSILFSDKETAMRRYQQQEGWKVNSKFTWILME